MAPRSEARLMFMHRDIIRPPPSKKQTDVIADIETWEGELTEYYKCGGDILTDRTKVLTALGMMPPETPHSLMLTLKDLRDLNKFKDQLRQDIRFLEDFGGLRKAAAHIVESPNGPNPLGPSIQEREYPAPSTAEPITEHDLPAFVFEQLSSHEREQLVLAVNTRKGLQGFRPRQQTQPGGQRRQPTPPRDTQDARCGNCGLKGHTARDCKKPRIPFADRKCHICGQKGHIANKCPDKDKPKVAVAETDRAMRILCVEDEEGLKTVTGRKPQPLGYTMADIPTTKKVPQGVRKRQEMVGNRFGVFCNDSDEHVEETTNSQREQRKDRTRKHSFVQRLWQDVRAKTTTCTRVQLPLTYRGTKQR